MYMGIDGMRVESEIMHTELTPDLSRQILEVLQTTGEVDKLIDLISSSETYPEIRLPRSAGSLITAKIRDSLWKVFDDRQEEPSRKVAADALIVAFNKL